MCDVGTTRNRTHYHLRRPQQQQQQQSLKHRHPPLSPLNKLKVSLACLSKVFTSPTGLRAHQYKIGNRPSAYHQLSCFHQTRNTLSYRGKVLVQQQRQQQPRQHPRRWQLRLKDHLVSQHRRQPHSWTSPWRMRTSCSMHPRASCHRPCMGKGCTISPTCRRRGQERRQRAAAAAERRSASSRCMARRRSRIFEAV